MKKRLVLTIDETGEGSHEIRLDDGYVCYELESKADKRSFERLNAIDLGYLLLMELEGSKTLVRSSREAVKEERQFCVDRIKEVEIRERDIELRREIVAAMIGDAFDKDFVERVDSIYNWIKEGKV